MGPYLMTELTRRRLHKRFESWGIFYGDVQVGHISKMIGLGSSVIWQWSCGFYGCETHQQSSGNQDSFDEAKAAFAGAWNLLQPQITEAMLDEWRKHQAWTAWKYAMIDAGCRLPTQSTTGRARCFCGAEITIAGFTDHVYAEHMGAKQTTTA